MKIPFAALLLVLAANFAFAQDGPNYKYQLKGVIRNKSSAVIPGLSLRFHTDTTDVVWLTDINGEFEIGLNAGNYELTLDEVAPEHFKVFIKIQPSGLNPEWLDLVVDTGPIHSGPTSAIGSPKIIDSVTPTFPPAARAVRAVGPVIVVVRIDSGGAVTEAKAISGHPLLRVTSERAAQKFLFDSIPSGAEREARLTFIFLPSAVQKAGLTRYTDPFRIPVTSEPEVFNTTATLGASDLVERPAGQRYLDHSRFILRIPISSSLPAALPFALQ